MRLGLSICSGAALLIGCSSSGGFGITGPTAFGEPAFNVGTDDRPTVAATTAPPPISGGTLLVTHDGAYAVAADPDRDRVSIVDMRTKSLLGTVALNTGDEPGRLTEDTSGLVHVALRRGGAVAAIDPGTATVVRRTPVCGSPRGIAVERATKLIHVACASGELVSLPAAGGDVTRNLKLGTDLRDVIVTPTGLVVSRFKAAALLRVDVDGNVTKTVPTQRIGRHTDTPTFDSSGTPGPQVQAMEPAVAWRAAAAPNGDIMLLHQYGLAEPIQIGHDAATNTPLSNQPYGSPPGMTGCGGLVSPAVSTLNGADEMWMGAQISAPVLTVDMSVSPDGMWVALAHAGTVDPSAPTFNNGPGIIGATSLGHITVMGVTTTVGQDPETTPNCATPEFTFQIAGQTTAVAFNPVTDRAQLAAQDTWLVAQTREPAQLFFVHNPSDSSPTMVSLGGAPMLDTGHELFHRDSGAGIACAECHAEGGEDGRVWKFKPTGPRRTQSLHVGVAGTEPFHWDGDMSNLGVIMEEVFVKRMGGAHQSPDRVEALKSWLSGLTPPAAIGDPASAEAARGKALFESAGVGCSSCHNGAKHTNSQSVNVGTTDPWHMVQVPSLVGIGYRAPYLHNGCAATLRARFDPDCGGGDSHGRTSQLSEAEIGDLVSYLETL
jgi:Cytochrome c